MENYFEIIKENREEILSKNGVLDVLNKYEMLKEAAEEDDDKKINTISNCFSNSEKEFFSNIVEFFEILNDIEAKIIVAHYKGKFNTLEEDNEVISALSIIQEISKYSTTINDKQARNEVDLEVGFIIAEILELLHHLQYSKKTIDCYLQGAILAEFDNVIKYFYKSIGINIDSNLVYDVKDDENKQQVDIKDVVMSLITDIYYC